MPSMHGALNVGELIDHIANRYPLTTKAHNAAGEELTQGCIDWPIGKGRVWVKRVLNRPKQWIGVGYQLFQGRRR
jgi:hypothetical protein